MKTRLTLISVSLLIQLNAQVIFKLDSIHQFSWNQTMMQWNHNTRELLTYDNGGNKETNLLRLTGNSSSWENFYQFNKSYNANNDLMQEIQQTWNGSSWDNASRRNYTYNVDDLLFIEDYAISSGPSTWLVFDQHSYIYDAQGRLIEDELQELNFSTMLLENKERWTYSFTGNLKDQDLLEEWNFANVWENDERKNYLYDSNNVLESIEERSWTVSDNWSDPYRRTLFYYNSDALISEVLQQNNVSDIWINNERVLNSYTNLNLTSILGQTWSNSMSVWENEYQILQSFDADDNMTEQIYQNWEISDWENFLRIVNYWSPEATLNIEFYNMDDLAAKIFPNPSHGFIHIDFNKVLLDKTSIELYTVSGQLMLKRQIEDNLDHITVPLENMESGVYFLNIRNANSKQVYKIIRQ